MTHGYHRRSIGLLLLALSFASFTSPARASMLWYNGDYDGRTSLTNESKVPINTGSGYVLQTSLVYDNFTVPVGQTWTINSVFSNDLLSYYVAPTMATWQIRTGVSAGNGGTIVPGGSGDTAVTLTPLSGVTTPAGYTAETVSATVPALVLTAGTYWLSVAADSAGYYGDQGYVLTTSGANSIDTKGNDGDSFINNTYPTTGTGSYNFAATTTALAKRGVPYPYGQNIDFSMGVVGTAVIVPEPASVTLVVFGLFGSLAWAKKRRSALAR